MGEGINRYLYEDDTQMTNNFISEKDNQSYSNIPNTMIMAYIKHLEAMFQQGYSEKNY